MNMWNFFVFAVFFFFGVDGYLTREYGDRKKNFL